ncbi:uncharacterized protein LOC125225638 [Leguminivora glycinivorella]|uniref:uncharacterized protein LOC125225638 n=1 Tax=Leguminivora glycinivorella TaxID=1035111 RepID=UPI00200CE888|nr:uncharacterized protein LOC125225638 [Leguminivora glycinivorella]
MRHRRKYLLFKGVPEDSSENTSTSITSIITDQLKIPDVTAASLRACHRLGKLSDGRARPILVRFEDLSLKSLIWQKKTALKGTSFALSEFLTPHRQELFSQARRAFGMKCCWSLEGNIFVRLSTGVRERIESDEDIQRLREHHIVRQPQITSTPDAEAAEEQSKPVAADSGNGSNAGRSRREKPIA